MFFRRGHRAGRHGWLRHGFSLADLRPGQEGIITRVHGGPRLLMDLENLGLRSGVRVKSVSRHFFRGPVVVIVGNSRVALGFGMARNIQVKPAGEE